MDFFGEMRVLQDRLAELARQNNEQALDLIQLTSKVTKLGEGGGGGIDTSGIKYYSYYDVKSSNSFGSIAHIMVYNAIGNLQPRTLYLVSATSNIYVWVKTGFDADLSISGTFSANNSGNVVYGGSHTFQDSRRVDATDRGAGALLQYNRVFTLQTGDFDPVSDPDDNPDPGRFTATVSVGGNLHGSTTTLSNHGDWSWRAGYAVAIPIGTI